MKEEVFNASDFTKDEQQANRDLARHIAHGFVDNIHKIMKNAHYPEYLQKLVIKEIHRDTYR